MTEKTDRTRFICNFAAKFNNGSSYGTTPHITHHHFDILCFQHGYQTDFQMENEEVGTADESIRPEQKTIGK
jgi:hypothetical protein